MLLNAYISPRTKNYDFFVQNAENKIFFKKVDMRFLPDKIGVPDALSRTQV